MTRPEDRLEKGPNATVQQQDPDAIPPTTFVLKRRTPKDKLGLYNIVVLSLGTIAILLAVAFLAFIWTVANNNTKGGDLPQLWRLIVKKEWVSRVVTLCSIVIRVAAAAQLCVFAAIVAALILERVGASTEDLPLLSMVRCANSGPNALIWNVIHTMGSGTQVGYSILIVVTILNALVMQFTSTLLLADLRLTPIVLENIESDMYYSISTGSEVEGQGITFLGINPWHGSDIWRTGSQSYPRFAEHRASASAFTSNFSDTGKIYRGFLPMRNANQRNVVRHYTGPMSVVDARVLCVKPTLSNITFQFTGNENDQTGSISGALDVTNIHPELSVQKDLTFNCSVPNLDLTHSNTWNASLCILYTGYGQLLNGISPEASDQMDQAAESTIAAIFLNTTRLAGLYSDIVATNTLTSLEEQDSSIAPWAKFGNKDISFDLSMCYINPLPRDYELTVRSASDATSDVGNDVISGAVAGSVVYDTSRVQKMMGVDGSDLTPEQRQLLTIVPPTNWNASRMNSLYKTQGLSYLIENLASYAAYTSEEISNWQLALYSLPENVMHRSHVALLQAVLSRSANPALAMQALYTVLLELSYYDLLPVNNMKHSATYGLAERILIPTRWTCFAAVMGILGLHLVLVCIALILFVAGTEMSLLGNAWQAVSQVMSIDTAEAVKHAAMATDDEVKDNFKSSGVADGKIRIAKCEHSGRTEARTVIRQS